MPFDEFDMYAEQVMFPWLDDDSMADPCEELDFDPDAVEEDFYDEFGDDADDRDDL